MIAMYFLALLQVFSILFVATCCDSSAESHWNATCSSSGDDTDSCSSTISSDVDGNDLDALDALDADDPDFDLLNFNASDYDYGEFPCPGLSAGWTCDYSAEFSHRDGDHFFCDVDTISPDMSVEEFNSKYLFKKPVLIDTKLEDWADADFWSKASLIRNYGDFEFEAGRSLELVLNSGIGSTAISLRDWLRDPFSLHLDADVSGPYDGPFKEALYIFDRSIWNEEDGFKDKHFDAPPFLANGDPEYGILFLGPTGTGATWHGHGETWAAEAYGRKRWMLYPPEITPPGGFWPGYSAKDWYFNIYPHLYDTINMSDVLDFNQKQDYHRHSIFERTVNGKNKMINEYEDIFKSDNEEWNAMGKSGLYKPIECIQKEGQLLYLPEFWFHAVLNLGDVVAAGIQTSQSYTQWMQEIDLLGEWEKEMNFEGQRKLHKSPLTDLETEVRQWNLLKLYKRLEQMSPNNAIRPFMVGYNYYELEKREQAIRKMTEALKMDPTYIEAYSNLGQIYMESSSESQRKKGEHLWRIAYMLNHNNPRVRENLIKLFEEQGKSDLAEMVLRHEKLPPMEDFKKVRKERYKKMRQERQYKMAQKQKAQDPNETQEEIEGTVARKDAEAPEPTEKIMEERRNEPRPEAPELGTMANNVI